VSTEHASVQSGLVASCDRVGGISFLSATTTSR